MASPAISAPPDVVVGEGDGYVDLVVSLSAPGTSPVSVHFDTASASASPGTVCNLDFVPTGGTLTFASGETTKVVRVDINDCADPEILESFTLGLSAAVGGTIARASTRIDIVDNDSGVNVYSYGISPDVYTVAALSDVIIENPGGGTDLVMTSLTYTLGANLENLTLTGTAARNGIGNSANNKLIGNSATNTLSGLAGDDTLDGAAGADTLTGGPGNDTLTGGPGADIFAFTSLVGADSVADFDQPQDSLRFVQSGIHIGDGDATVEGAVTRSAAGGFSKNAELVVFTSNIVGEITVTSAAAKIGSATSAYATGDDRLFVVDNGTHTGIYRFRSSGANALVSASELIRIALVGYAPGTTSTSVSDYLFAP